MWKYQRSYVSASVDSYTDFDDLTQMLSLGKKSRAKLNIYWEIDCNFFPFSPDVDFFHTEKNFS